MLAVQAQEHGHEAADLGLLDDQTNIHRQTSLVGGIEVRRRSQRLGKAGEVVNHMLDPALAKGEELAHEE